MEIDEVAESTKRSFLYTNLWLNKNIALNVRKTIIYRVFKNAIHLSFCLLSFMFLQLH